MKRADPAAPAEDRPGVGARIRVVTLVDRLSTQGGAEHLALMTATRLDAERFDSIFSVSRWPPPPHEAGLDSHRTALTRLEDSGTRFLPLRRRRKIELGAWRRLAAFLRRER